MFMVFFDDESGLYFPLGWDLGCEGGLEGSHAPALFESRESARHAIQVSTLNAKLLKKQGRPYDDTFIDSLKNVKILQCVLPISATSPEKP